MKSFFAKLILVSSILFAPLSSYAETYEEQAAALLNPLLSSIPNLTGDAIGARITQVLTGDTGSQTIVITDGLSARLGEVSLSPIGATVTFTMNQFEVVPASDNTEAVYATGVVNGRFGYNLVTQKISLALDSADYGPVVYTGGQLSGTTVEFNNLGIVVNTSKFIPFWEKPVTVKGAVKVNGVSVPLEELIKLIGLIKDFS